MATFAPIFPLLPPPQDLPLYAVFLLIPILGGFLSFFSSDCSPGARRWRSSLRKSSLALPTVVVAPMWTVLYLCMGHASYRAYVAERRNAALASGLVAYLTQLLLNHFFIIVLFGLQRIDLAMLMALPLWLSTFTTIILFYDVDPPAAMLMVPVLIWITYNAYLNIYLFLNNPVYTELDLPNYARSSSTSPSKPNKLE